MALEREVATYRRELPRLLAEHPGKFVLIHGDELLGVFDTQEEALIAGYERFPFEAFLAKEVREDEPALFFTRNVKPCHS